MKLLIITSMLALILVAGLSAVQLRADDAHHPEKGAKAKKATAKTSKQPEKKKPPSANAKKSNQSE
jgi:hypothetical protein